MPDEKGGNHDVWVKQSSNSNRPKKEWKLEDSSLWWLSHDMFRQPSSVLFLSSIPFCMGAYYGYKSPMENLDALVGPTSSSSATTGPTKSANVDGKSVLSKGDRLALGSRMAWRALRLATLGSVGTFCMIGAAGFYACGYQSVGEAVDKTRVWASTCMKSFEGWLGMDDRPSKTHPEVLATRHMTEEEELDYIYEKYIKEPEQPLQVAESDVIPSTNNNPTDK